jgi:hypothetical protein
MRISNDLQIGKAGEYFTCGDLIIKGFIAYPSEQGLPYDIVLDIGTKMLKIQVKTCSIPRRVHQRNIDSFTYIFNIKRHGKNNTKIYTNDEVDIFALVALDTKQIGYIKNVDMPSTLNIRVEQYRGTYYDEKGVEDYKKVIEIYKNKTKNQSEIARMLNLHISTVNRMLQEVYKPFITNAIYMDDIKRDKKWFLI